MKTVPHKHQHEIKAWADGAQIQARQFDGPWQDCVHSPSWSKFLEYRVKPIPDVVIETVMQLNAADGTSFPGAEYNTSTENNLRLSFNGFTGKLRKAEVI